MRYHESPGPDLGLLSARTDYAAQRARRLLALPDLSRTPGSPVFYTTQAILQLPVLTGHDLVEFPEIVPAEKNFDLLGTPAGHPSRRPSDTFYVDERHVLRTQTTTMWSYYLTDPELRRRLSDSGTALAVSYGAVYRNDEIDRTHYPAFHQMDGLCLTRRSAKTMAIEDLVWVLVQIAQGVYGPHVRWRTAADTFPFTHPSIELQIQWKGEWVEILGAGLVHSRTLHLLGIDPAEYNGWAFGFGLDRLAMIKMNVPDIRILWSQDPRITRQFTGLDSSYSEVSRYPHTDRDVSFLVRKDLRLNAIYGVMRDCGLSGEEDIIETVELVDTYADERKFGPDRVSYTFRIRYRSHVRTLTTDEINAVQEALRLRVVEEFGAELR